MGLILLVVVVVSTIWIFALVVPVSTGRGDHDLAPIIAIVLRLAVCIAATATGAVILFAMWLR